jgi:hypothetical protein
LYTSTVLDATLGEPPTWPPPNKHKEPTEVAARDVRLSLRVPAVKVQELTSRMSTLGDREKGVPPEEIRKEKPKRKERK